MKQSITLTAIALFIAIATMAQPKEHLKKVQDYVRTANDKWQPSGLPYLRPDTLTTAYAYHWKRERIAAVQAYKKVNGEWVKNGEPYPLPDTVKLIHALVK